MKKNIILIVVIIAVLRLLDIYIWDSDPVFYLSPRNFNGQGLLSKPSIIDFLIPLTVIFALRKNIKFNNINFKNLLKPLQYAFILILAPIVAGFMLSNYAQETLMGFDFNLVLLLRYILFVLTFVSINIFADALPFSNKLIRNAVLFFFLLIIAYTQDIFDAFNPEFTILGLLNSVGVSTVLIAVGMRKIYKKYPAESILAVAIAGIFLIFFRYNVISSGFFTIFLPMAAFLTVAIALYKIRDTKARIIIIAIPYIIAAFLNYALPSLLPPGIASQLLEKVNEKEYKTERYGDITVKYTDEKLKDIALNLARVIAAANKLSEEYFGFSPAVKELELRGIAPGGFRAVFPAKITGNIISKTYLENCADSAFLNAPGLRADFPDPVNGILHEYSHLYGVVPYYKWMPGAEEEGWATYSATRLSQLLHKKYGDTLWQPAYDYSKQAGKITAQNLSGKAVTWSHVNEYGGFNLWYNIGKELGIKELYKKRWQNTIHDSYGDFLLYSNPVLASKVVTAFGKNKFLKYGQLPERKFGDIYSMEDYLYMAKITGMDTMMIKNMYVQVKDKTINPSVPLPE